MNHCGCNDWQVTQRRALLRRQGQVVPIPRAVLEGESAGMCRRDFLRNGAIAFLTVYGAQMVSWNRIWEVAAAQAATPATDPIIVSIFLDGGNDGLNTLVPITGSDAAAYAAKRPNIGLQPQNCLPLAGPAATPDGRLDTLIALAQGIVERQEDDPFGNPVLAMALLVSRRLDEGILSLDDIEDLIRQLRDEAFLERATRLRA